MQGVYHDQILAFKGALVIADFFIYKYDNAQIGKWNFEPKKFSNSQEDFYNYVTTYFHQ